VVGIARQQKHACELQVLVRRVLPLERVQKQPLDKPSHVRRSGELLGNGARVLACELSLERGRQRAERPLSQRSGQRLGTCALEIKLGIGGKGAEALPRPKGIR
jgi:hypothetical protein